MRSPKFTANAEVDQARAKLSKRLTTMFVPHARLTDRLPTPTQRCPGCGYWVQGTCSTCKEVPDAD